MRFFYKCLVISILLHIFFLFFAGFSVEDNSKKDIVEIELYPNKQWDFADILPPENEEIPEDAKFLGLYSTRVKDETVAEYSRLTGMGDVETDSNRLDYFQFQEAALRKKGLGRSLSEDWFPDYQKGPHTYLNIFRYPDADYFIRLRRAFKIAFNPRAALESFTPGFFQDTSNLEAFVTFSINREGELIEVYVEKGSGLPSFDQEILRMIRASAPFARPPEKFLEVDGIWRLSGNFTLHIISSI